MEYKDILSVLAPCGLDCSTCMSKKDGEISALSERFLHLLGNGFDRYAGRFSSFQPVFRNYPQFRELLEHFAKADCTGCRSGACRYPGCVVHPCSREKGVDFCFQCGEFPCEKATFDPDLKRRWIEMNDRMRAIGVEAYYQEVKALPRYR